MDDLRAFLDAQPLVVERLTCGEGALAFTVDIQHVDKATLEKIGTASIKVVRDRQGERREANLPKFRELLRDHCLQGWSGLTKGIVAAMCAREVPADATLAAQPVEFTPGAALVMLEKARCTQDGAMVSFDDWVYEAANKLATAGAVKDADVKNG